MRAQVFELREHILLDGDVELFCPGSVRVFFVHDAPCGFGVRQPVAQCGKGCGRRRIEQTFHRPAMRVAADDDVLDAKASDREFDGRRFAAAHGAVGRHEIAGVAQDKKVSRRRLGEQAWVDTRIGAGDEQRLRRLALGQAFE